MNKRKILGIVFLVLAIVGVVFGLWWLMGNQIPVSGKGYSGVYDLAKKSFEGTMGWSFQGGFNTSTSTIRDEAIRVKNIRIWCGFVSAVLCACIGIYLFMKTDPNETLKETGITE